MSKWKYFSNEKKPILSMCSSFREAQGHEADVLLFLLARSGQFAGRPFVLLISSADDGVGTIIRSRHQISLTKNTENDLLTPWLV